MGNVVYNSSDGIIEIIVRNEFGAKVDHFKMNMRDRTAQWKIAHLLFQKYEIDFNYPKTKDSIFEF